MFTSLTGIIHSEDFYIPCRTWWELLWCSSVCKPASCCLSTQIGLLTTVKMMYLPFIGHLCLCSVFQLTIWSVWILFWTLNFSNFLINNGETCITFKVYNYKREKKLHILLNYQRWKSATHVGHKASWDTERPDSTLCHLSMQPSTNSMNFVILHSYQKMVHSTQTKDGQWSARDILCFQDYKTVMIDVGRLKKKKGDLLGLRQVCVQF